MAQGSSGRNAPALVSRRKTLLLFLPVLASSLLPAGWDELLKYLPSNAADAFTSIGQATGTLLTPGIGAAVFTAWIAVAMVGAAWAVLRRDA